MIAKLTGNLDTFNDSSLIIDVNGVGYLVYCPSRTLGSLGHKGESVTLFIETLMRSESLQLYGFKTQEEQACFNLLTTVQGVGARMGLSLLSAFCSTDIYHAISTQDKVALTRAEGVGPKLASRMVTELKDKVPTIIRPTSSPTSHPSNLGSLVEEAVSALVNLGYRRLEAVTVISKLNQQEDITSLSDLIRQGLALLARTGA